MIRLDSDKIISGALNPANSVIANLQGVADNGKNIAIPVTSEGHLEIAIHSPRLPFGSLHVENARPEFQSDGVYGFNANQIVTTVTGSGNVSTSSSMFVASTGVVPFSFASIQSRKRLRYRPGQGIMGRFTAVFPSTPTANSRIVAGFGTAEAGFFVGYVGTSFGIIYITNGVREVRTLQVAVGSSQNETVNLTLDGLVYPVTATNSANATRTAYEISIGSYIGWTAQQNSSSVIFLADDAVAQTGSFGIAATSASGTFTLNITGSNATRTFVSQSQWNGDTLNGSGSSGFALQPSLGNIYQFDIQYLGFGSVILKVEATPSSMVNNPNFVIAHTFKFPGTRTIPTISNPSFPFTLAAYSSGSAANLSVQCASFAGFIEGQKQLHGNRLTYTAITASVDAVNYTSLMTIRNQRVFANRANQSVVNVISLGGSIKSANPATLYLIKNATLTGVPSFNFYASSSCVYIDIGSPTCTFSDNNQVIYSVPIGDGGGTIFVPFEDDITLQPGETLTLAAKSASGSPTFTLMSLNTREDQ